MKTYYLVAILLLPISYSFSQDCNCDHTIEPSSGGQIFNANNNNVQPGDTICMMAGTYNQYMAFYDLAGTEENPIVITNCGGLVVMNATTTGFDTYNSHDFVITGTGSEDHFYGIEVNDGTDGIRLNYFSNNYRVDHVKIDGASNHGLDLKNDPLCSDPRTWRSSGLVNESIVVHDTYVVNIGREGFYIGGSHYHTQTPCLGQNPQDIEEAPILKAEIYNNVVKNTGNDGIQIGSVTEEALIYNNVVTDFGVQDGTGVHRSGFQINPGTKAVMYSNIVARGVGTAYFISGDGVLMYNNIAFDAKSGVESYESLTTSESRYVIYNNTFVDIFESGVAVIAPAFTRSENKFFNNIVQIDPGADYYGYGSSLAWTEANNFNNLYTDDMNGLNLEDLTNLDLRPTTQSTLLIDLGDCSSTEVEEDFDGYTRVYGSACDIGAHEYTEASLAINPSVIDFGELEVDEEVTAVSYSIVGENLRSSIKIPYPDGYSLYFEEPDDVTGDTVTIEYGELRGLDTVIFVKPNTEAPGNLDLGMSHITDELNDVVLDLAATVVGPTIELNKSTIDFGEVYIGSEDEVDSYTLEAYNLTADLIITFPEGIQLSIGDEEGFSSEDVTINRDSNNEVNEQVFVRFLPDAAGEYNGEIVHSTTGGNTGVVIFSGSAEQPPTLSANHSSVTFENPVFQSETSQENYSVQIVAENLVGSLHILVPTDFVVSFDDETFFSDNFEISESEVDTTLNIYFEPESLGEIISELVFASEDVDTVVINLNGSARELPSASISTTSLSFESTIVNTITASQSYTIIGDNFVEPISIKIPENWKVSLDGGETIETGTLSLAPTDGTIDAEVEVYFEPQEIGVIQDRLTHWSLGLDTISIQLNGEGLSIPEINLNATALEFDDQIINTGSEVLSYSINATNLIDDLVIVLPNDNWQVLLEEEGDPVTGSQVSLSPLDGEIDTTIFVVFLPVIAGSANSEIKHVTTGADSTLLLIGTGLEPIITITPLSIEFGAVSDDEVGNVSMSYQLEGQNLSTFINIDIPENISLTIDNENFLEDEMEISPIDHQINQEIFVHITSLELGILSAEISHSSIDAETVVVDVVAEIVKALSTSEETGSNTIFPNPVKPGNVLKIKNIVESPIDQISLLDISGSEIPLQAKGDGVRLPESIGQGVYLIHVKFKDGNFLLEKLIIK